MSGTADPIPAEVVAGVPAPEGAGRAQIDWDGATWDVPATADDLPYEATVAWARLAQAAEEDDRSLVQQVHVDDFLRAVLGPAGHRRLVRGRKVGEVNGFLTALFAHWRTTPGE